MIGSLKKWWNILQKKPFGKKIFSIFLGKLIPYTGSISPLVLSLEPGIAVVMLNDKKKLRNHLSSIHAIALVNLGELCTGLALHFLLQNQARAILTELTINYIKKARGKITARAEISPMTIKEKDTISISCRLFDEKNVDVAHLVATWRYENNSL